MSEQLMMEILTAILLVVVFSGFIFTGMHYLAKYLRENSFPGWHAPPHLFAPEVVWCDEPPFVDDGAVHLCWMQGEDYPVLVARVCDRLEYRAIEDPRWKPLAGRRVSPIVKPQEPPQ